MTTDPNKRIYVLDYYTNKYSAIEVPQTADFLLGEKLIVGHRSPDGKVDRSIATYIGDILVPQFKPAQYLGRLDPSVLDDFDRYQHQAREKFPMFKKMFKTAFPSAIPVTAKYQLYSKQWYFYFYAEERFNFVEFIKEFRQVLGAPFFLFQVGARDMIKLSPATDDIVGCNGKNLCCKSNRPLPSIEIEHLLIQHLDGRDIERLKGRCGKLKCSLIYEVETYITESAKFPEKGSTVDLVGCKQCGTVTNFNILTNMLEVQLDDQSRISIPLEEIKQAYPPKNPPKKHKDPNTRRLIEQTKGALGQ